MVRRKGGYHAVFENVAMSEDFHICYCFPRGNDHLQYAFRFLNSYLTFPPQVEHTLVLLTDFGNEPEALELFATVPNVRAVGTPDYAKDLSRYEAYSKQCGASCMMMLGGSSYCHRPGWGLRALTAFQKLGSSAILGTCGHTGAPGVHKHLRSTGWWTSPDLLRKYPYWPKDHAGRYGAEHGSLCFSAWAQQIGFPIWVVSFAGEYPLERSQDDPNGYARGNQTNVLIGDRLSGPGAPRYGLPWQT